MAAPNEDLQTNSPDAYHVVLVLIDVINDLEFEGGVSLFEHGLPMAQALSKLCERARGAGVPVIYVNDNFGRWRSDFNAQVQHCLNDGVRGESIARLLQPQQDDYFVLKPRHSGFFSTALDLLLKYLGVHTLMLTGIATENCVLFTANDAYLRDYRLVIPPDCSASQNEEVHRQALAHMERVLKADIRDSKQIDFVLLRKTGCETTVQ